MVPAAAADPAAPMTPAAVVSRFDEASSTLASCPVLADARRLTAAGLGEVLVQRRLVSLAFTPFYDMLIDALESPTARLVCRQILREEYPDPAGNSPSHRELLVQDMVALGIDRDGLLQARPTAATTAAILGSFELVVAAAAAPCRELALLATAACYGELLVTAEYLALQPRIEDELGPQGSVFYGPHLLHDSGHAKRLLAEVALRLDPSEPGRVAACIDAVERCLAVKLAFYEQFGDLATRDGH